MPDCVHIIAVKVKDQATLYDNSIAVINKVVMVYEKVVDSILNADITISDYHRLEKYKERILALRVISKEYAQKSQDIELAFKNRSEEYLAFTCYLADIGKIWQTCKSFFPPSINVCQ